LHFDLAILGKNIYRDYKPNPIHSTVGRGSGASRREKFSGV